MPCVVYTSNTLCTVQNNCDTYTSKALCIFLKNDFTRLHSNYFDYSYSFCIYS